MRSDELGGGGEAAYLHGDTRVLARRGAAGVAVPSGRAGDAAVLVRVGRARGRDRADQCHGGGGAAVQL